MTDAELQQVFVEYGVFALCKAMAENTEADPKLYETISKYLDKKELGTLPELGGGEAYQDKLEKLRAKYGKVDDE